MKNKWPLLLVLTLTVIFKNVTQYDLVNLVLLTFKQTKKVDSLVMKKAKRGLIEYEGNYSGPPQELVEVLTIAVSNQFKVESQQKENDLEMTLTKQTP